MKDIILIKDSLRQNLFEDIKKEIMSDGFSWFYTGTTLGANTNSSDKFNYSFFHNAYYHDDGYSPIGKKIEHAILDCLNYMKLPITKMLRIRLGLVTITENTVVHTPHVDFPFEHKTGLLYINDSDGDTILYQDHYDTTIDKTESDNNVRNKEKEIITTITPEANKLVIFDGLIYHSSSSPTMIDRRVVINFNYL